MHSVPASDRPDYIATFDQVADRAREVKSLLESRQIRLHPASVLGQLMKKAETLSREWAFGEQNVDWRDWLFSALQVNRICSAVLGVGEDSGAQEALKRIASNDMNLLRHDQTQGKDAFFEIELADYLRRHSMKAVLTEPDILLKLDSGDYPVACKKINSVANLEKQLKKGAHQLRPFCGVGLIALNVDLLVPENSILMKRSAVEVKAELIDLIKDFREENRLMLQKPVAEEACDGILFSITAMTHVEQMRPHVSYCTQIEFWALSDANHEGRQRVFAFEQILRKALKARREALR